MGRVSLLSPSALAPGNDTLSWMDHSAHREHAGDDDLCEGAEGWLSGRVQDTGITGWLLGGQGHGQRLWEEQKHKAGTAG